MQSFEIIVKTYFGFEDVLAQELEQLGASNIEKLKRAVSCEVNKEQFYACNYWLRTGLFVLKPIAKFEANNEDELYDEIQKIDWSEYIDNDSTFAINSTAFSDKFTHSKYVALKMKDAIVDQFRKKTGDRPSINVEDPDLMLEIHVANNQFTVSLNSSGESLAKRGYRTQQTKAPLSEALAAGIIIMTGWNGETDFLDPMCGSGTFPIEAAMIAGNRAPGRFRTFNFENWNDFDPTLWRKVKQDAKEQEKQIKCGIYGKDKNQRAVRVSEDNMQRAGLSQVIEIERKNFLNTRWNADSGLIIMNPPYGERLEDAEEMVDFYAEIGTHLKHYYPGCEAWIFSGNLEALKFIGLRPTRRIKLFNGQLECKLHKFELFQGKKSELNG